MVSIFYFPVQPGFLSMNTPHEIEAHGFMLLQTPSTDGYRGVDRNPFVPLILENELDSNVVSFETVWELYPKGWRRSLYKIFIDNQNLHSIGDVELINTMEIAWKIANLIPASEGVYEIVECRVFSSPPFNYVIDSSFIGYDIAYPGDDYYSAIQAGLIFGPHPKLESLFFSKLNSAKLFSEVDILKPYLDSFRENVLSESESEFVFYALSG